MASAVPAASSVAAHCPVGSAVGSVPAIVAPIVATTVPSTSVSAGRNACVGVRSEPDDGERRVGGRRGVDGRERAGQRLPAVVEGVVVGHRRHVDAGGGERLEGGRRSLEGEPLVRFGAAAASHRGLQVDDRDVGGGQGLRWPEPAPWPGRRAGPAGRPRSGRRPPPRSSAASAAPAAGSGVGSGRGRRVGDDRRGGRLAPRAGSLGPSVADAQEATSISAATRPTPAARPRMSSIVVGRSSA